MAQHFTIPAAQSFPVSPALAIRVMNRDLHQCVYCGRAGGFFDVDHVRPQSHFSAMAAAAVVNAPTNLVTACKTCNNTKNSQNLTSFAAMLRGRGVSAAKVAAMKARVRNATRRKLP